MSTSINTQQFTQWLTNKIGTGLTQSDAKNYNIDEGDFNDANVDGDEVLSPNEIADDGDILAQFTALYQQEFEDDNTDVGKDAGKKVDAANGKKA